MGDWAKDVMKQVEKNARSQMRKIIEDRLRPFQSQIRNEGGTVKIVEKSKLETPFVVEMAGISEGLRTKINNALRK